MTMQPEPRVDRSFERRLKRRHETLRLCPRRIREGLAYAAAVPAPHPRRPGRRPRPTITDPGVMRRLTLTDAELAVTAEALREV
jgi:hypothetical protein